MVDAAIAKKAAKTSGADMNSYQHLGSYLQALPYSCFVNDKFMLMMADGLSMIWMMAWIGPGCSLASDLTNDKFKKIREALMLVGASTEMQTISWLVMPGGLLVASSVLTSIIMKHFIFISSDWICLFFLVLSYVISLMGLAICVSSSQKTPSKSSLVFFLAVFFSELFYGATQSWAERMPFEFRMIACLAPGTAMAHALGNLAQLQIMAKGVTLTGTYTMSWSRDTMYYPSTAQICYMLCFQGFLFAYLGWANEKMNPGESGYPEPWYFIVTPGFWKRFLAIDNKVSDSSNAKACRKVDNDNLNYAAENMSKGKTAGVTVKNLSKTYANGFEAVKDMTMEFYKGQMTAFLGRNGAGKSSALNLLTGLSRASSGQAYIGDIDLIEQPEKAAQKIGNCPQYNILIDELTPIEHVEFYRRG